MKNIRIGTSGWTNKDWGKTFYPRGKKNSLAYFSGEFGTVEINSSFYRLPRQTVFEKWRDETPDDFIFAVKMSRFITHEKRLAETESAVELFLNNAKFLDKKFGVVLIQIPPSLKYDRKLFETFAGVINQQRKQLKVKPSFAFEPRHKSWMENAEEVRKILKKARMGLVFPHSAKIPSFEPEDENITSKLVYIRFHGPSEFAASRYGESALRPWAKKIKKWAGKGLTVYVYFNNDVHGHAVEDARTLKKLLGIKK